jgi:hypothetical protein
MDQSGRFYVVYGSHGRSDTRINRELVNSNSRRRISVSLQFVRKSTQMISMEGCKCAIQSAPA